MKRSVLAFVTLCVGLVACAGQPGATTRLGPDQVANLVLAADARFTGIDRRDPDRIGQAAWYEVTQVDAGWRVRVRIGWGDCESGCIHEHAWTYAVDTTGSVRQITDEGDSLPAANPVMGVAVAGPVCPVERIPPDPSCADQPVFGAVMVVKGSGGVEVARTSTDADGRFELKLEPGRYLLEPQAVDGLLGTAAAQEIVVGIGEPMPELTVAYDTGIR